MRAMIFGAGLGTRLRPHTLVVAKPAIPLLGLPMLAYSLSEALLLGVSDIVINTHHLPESIQQAVSRLNLSPNVKTHYSNESPDILGGPGGIVNAQSFLAQSPLCSLNGDSITLFEDRNEYLQAQEFHNSGSQLFTFMTTKKQTHQDSGLWRDEQNYIRNKGVEIQQNLHFEHYVGVMFMKAEGYKLLSKGHLNIFDHSLKNQWKNSIAKTYFIENTQSFETGNIDDYLTSTFDLIEILLNKLNPFHTHLKDLLLTYFPKMTIREGIISLSGKALPALPGLQGLFVDGLPLEFTPEKIKGPFVIGPACDFSHLTSLDRSVINSACTPHGVINNSLIL